MCNIIIWESLFTQADDDNHDYNCSHAVKVKLRTTTHVQTSRSTVKLDTCVEV